MKAVLKTVVLVLSLTSVARADERSDVAQGGPSQEQAAAPAQKELGQSAPVFVSESIKLGPNSTPKQIEAIKRNYYEKVAKLNSFGTIVSQKVETKTAILLVKKSTGDNLADLIVNKYKGCPAIDDNCKSLIMKLNRSLDASNIDAALLPGSASEIAIPVQSWSAETAFNVGDKHRVSKDGNVTTEYYSKSLAQALNILPDPFFGGNVDAVAWDGAGNVYRTHKVFEEDSKP